MQQVGTPAFAAQYSEHPYFGVDLGKPRFGRNDVFEEAKLKSYFSKGAKLKGMLERAQKKGQVEEDSCTSGGDSEADADGLARKTKRRKKASGGAGRGGAGRGGAGRGGAGRGGAGRGGAGRGGAGRGGRGRGGAGRSAAGRGAAGGSGGAEMVATAQVTEDTLLSVLSSALVTGSRIGTTIAAQLPTATGVSTCGELADMEPAALAKAKIPRFPHVLALRAALRRRLRDGEPTDGGSGSGAGGMAGVAEGGATAPASDSPESAGVAEAAGAASGAESRDTVCDECCIKYVTLHTPRAHAVGCHPSSPPACPPRTTAPSPALCALPAP